MSIRKNNDLEGFDSERGAAVAVAEPRVKKPPMYKVVLLNDDFTPMDFVIEVLMSFFAMNQARATEVMLQVHYKGKGICGVYSKDVAETKVAQVTEYARSQNYPLLCTLEVE